MKRTASTLFAIGIACGFGCTAEQERGAAAATGSGSALSACPYPTVELAVKRGNARQTVDPPMTLPVPGTIPINSGPSGLTATLTYTLSADQDRPLECRYQRSGAQLSLVECQRKLDATSFIEARSVTLQLSDRQARARLTLCPDGPVMDEASMLPPPNVKAQRSDQLRAQAVATEPTPDGRTAQDVEAYVQAALQNDAVLALLGERSAFIHEIEVGNGKGAARNRHHLRLIFFSHTNNRAIEVVVDRQTVESAGPIAYWPPEGKDEIDQAVALAMLDPRITPQVFDLRAGGMVWQPTTDVSYVNHRVMDIRFYDDDLVSRYFATVDLTDQVVQEAGEVP